MARALHFLHTVKNLSLSLAIFLSSVSTYAVDARTMPTVASVEAQTYYERLGIKKTASKLEIKKAYRDKAMEFHGDHVSEALQDQATSIFTLYTDAYNTLYDDGDRAFYDQYGLSREQAKKRDKAAAAEQRAKDAAKAKPNAAPNTGRGNWGRTHSGRTSAGNSAEPTEQEKIQEYMGWLDMFPYAAVPFGEADHFASYVRMLKRADVKDRRAFAQALSNHLDKRIPLILKQDLSFEAPQDLLAIAMTNTQRTYLVQTMRKRANSPEAAATSIETAAALSNTPMATVTDFLNDIIVRVNGDQNFSALVLQEVLKRGRAERAWSEPRRNALLGLVDFMYKHPNEATFTHLTALLRDSDLPNEIRVAARQSLVALMQTFPKGKKIAAGIFTDAEKKTVFKAQFKSLGSRCLSMLTAPARLTGRLFGIGR